jgi:carboxyl-terminal processing protease
MVILVNGNTASASEILTAALQDNKAGTVIGTNTYGKGVTQMMHKFSDGTAVKLTVTEYFRPSGETVNGVGIKPDIEAEEEAIYEEAIKELTQ